MISNDHEGIAVSAICDDCSARDRKHIRARAQENQNGDVDVGQEFELVIVDRAEHFADAARATRDDLLGNFDGMSDPFAVRQRVPRDANFLAGLEAAQIGFIDKNAQLNMAQIRDFGEILADDDVISRVHGKRIERAVDRRDDIGGAHFAFERMNIVGILLDAKSEALNVERRSVIELGFALLERLQVGASALEIDFVLVNFRLSRGLLAKKFLQRLLRLFERLNFKLRGAKLTLQLSDLIRRAAAARVIQQILRGKEIGAGGLKLRGGVRIVEAQNFLAGGDGLAFFGAELRDKGGKFGAKNVGMDGLDLAVAAYRGDQIIVKNVNDLNLRRAIAKRASG